MAILPLVMTDQGLQPVSPADLRAQLIALVSATNPDYTANLPGSLIEDISSTDVFALIESDSFLVDLINSVTPFGANAFLLNQLGQVYGVDPQPVTNTSVYLVFTGPPGYVITQGFVVGDGTYQYVCQDGGIVGSDGNSLPIYALATEGGSWPVNPNTVNQFLTSVPSNIILTVTNPISGIPSTSGEPISVFRERTFTAGLASSTGMSRYLKTLVGNVPGVQNRLISVQQLGNQYVVLVGGGDQYQVAYAIWQSQFYTPGLIGAEIVIDNITPTNPAVITTASNHNLQTGDEETITGVLGKMGYINNLTLPVTVLTAKTFSYPVDATQWGKYLQGGIVEPNPINLFVTVSDYPDSFVIPYVNPPVEQVYMIVTWVTNSPNFVSPSAVAQAAVPVLVDYINSLPAGTTPINLNVLNQIFLDSISGIVQGEYIIDINFQLFIYDTASQVNVPVYPAAGTQVIYGDQYSYFFTQNGWIQVNEG